MSFKKRLAAKPIVLTPGVYDPLSASLAAMAGHEAVYLSGAAIAYTRFARPDIGLVSVSEVADTLALVRDAVDLPIVVDADTGFGNALNVQRTVRTFERAGATVIQLEDQTFPKRCGHLSEKKVVPMQEMVGKIKAAVDARRSGETLIMARTDAIAVEGFDKAEERAAAYVEAGADMLFVEAPTNREQMERIGAGLGLGKPMLANMVEGGRTPLLPAAELEKLGFAMVIFPAGVVRAIAHTARDFYATLKQHGTSDPFRPRMLDFDGLNDIIGTKGYLARGKAYEGE
jgi:2-methylisocitrate lyase-like PEP mutase family enzyme